MYLAKDIDALERVQHCATKLVKNLSALTDWFPFSYSHFTVVDNVET